VTVEYEPGERFEESAARVGGTFPGIWAHLGWTLVDVGPGRAVLEWTPGTDHSFAAGDGWIVHGGMVTAILDTAMGQSTWTLLSKQEVFLTADLRTEFYRPTSPGGLIRAIGHVAHKTRRVSFAAAELQDENGKKLASGRATNIIRRLPE
jgi:uncharacterized protein (TIGR00369 family)